MAAAAMAVLTAGAVSFTSCETFDDTEIKTSIDDLTQRVESLEEAIETLQGDVTTISNLLEQGKVIKSIADNEDGTYTITYVGEETSDIISVGGAGESLVTVINDGGTYYWGIVNNDGEVDYILGSDSKIPVAGEAPEFQFADNGSLQVKHDGAWVDTGVSKEDVASIVSDVAVGEGSVKFILKNGDSFEVPMTAELTCEFLSGKTAFEYGESKSLSINAGGFDKYELAVPFGWTASFSGNSIKVNAPYEGESASASGEVILRVYADGYVLMDKVTVFIPGEYDDVITISVQKTEDVLGDIHEKVRFGGVSEIFAGAMKLSDFTAEKAAALAYAEYILPVYDENYNPIENDYKYKYTLDVDYDENWYPVYSLELDFEDLCVDAEPEAGETYIIWAVAEVYDPYGGQAEDGGINADNVVTYMHVYSPSVEIGVSEVKFNDAAISIESESVAKYAYGISQKSDWFSVDNILSNFNWGDAPEFVSGSQNFSFAEYLGESNKAEAGATYVVWVVFENPNSGYEYTEQDVIMKEFSTAPYTYDGTLEIAFGEVTSTVSNVSVSYTAPEDYYLLKGMWIPDADYQGKSDQELVEYLLDNYSDLTPEYGTEMSEYLNPGDKGWFVAVAIDNEGRVGKVAKVEANAKALEFNKEMTISAEHTVDSEKMTVSIAFELSDDVTAIRYFNGGTSSGYPSWSGYPFSGSIDQFKNTCLTNPTQYPLQTVSVSDLTDGVLTLGFSVLNQSQTFAAVAVNADGEVSDAVVTFTYMGVAE